MSFWHCNCCKLQLQVALSFQQVLQLLRMLRRFSNHFSLIIRQCSAGRKDRRSAVNLLCFTLLLCHCAASSYCAAFAAAPLALLSFFAALPSPLPAMCSSAVASPSLINILSLLCAVVRSSCSAAAAAASCPVAAQPLSLPLPLSLCFSLCRHYGNFVRARLI